MNMSWHLSKAFLSDFNVFYSPWSVLRSCLIYGRFYFMLFNPIVNAMDVYHVVWNVYLSSGVQLIWFERIEAVMFEVFMLKIYTNQDYIKRGLWQYVYMLIYFFSKVCGGSKSGFLRPLRLGFVIIQLPKGSPCYGSTFLVEPSTLIGMNGMEYIKVFFLADAIVKIVMERSCMNLMIAHGISGTEFGFHVTCFLFSCQCN